MVGTAHCLQYLGYFGHVAGFDATAAVTRKRDAKPMSS